MSVKSFWNMAITPLYMVSERFGVKEPRKGAEAVVTCSLLINRYRTGDGLVQYNELISGGSDDPGRFLTSVRPEDWDNDAMDWQ